MPPIKHCKLLATTVTIWSRIVRLPWESHVLSPLFQFVFLFFFLLSLSFSFSGNFQSLFLQEISNREMSSRFSSQSSTFFFFFLIIDFPIFFFEVWAQFWLNIGSINVGSMKTHHLLSEVREKICTRCLQASTPKLIASVCFSFFQ